MAVAFHSRCGERVTLINSNRTAVRNFSEFNNGLVLSSQPLADNQLFQVRIDKKINSWSGSIEIGVTCLNPETMEFPSTASELRGGSWILSGTSVLKDGQSIVEVYGEDLEKLAEGDCVGVMRTSEGELVFYVNEESQGVAARDIPSCVYGFVDMYGKCAQVTVIDDDDETRGDSDDNLPEEDNVDRLMFHPNCGTHAAVINNHRTAHRPHAMDDFNNGVVLTNRPLRPGELFEVRLDKMVTKWAGSIEIGVTMHNPTELEFPSTMTNVRSGTWMMTGNGVMHNGLTVIHEYGQNLDRLQVGDRVGVMRTEEGTLHFFVNGVDQGSAGAWVPEQVYGVIDLYGQAVQATIVDPALEREQQRDARAAASDAELATADRVGAAADGGAAAVYSDLRFRHSHGKKARLSNGGTTASRAFAEFNDAVLVSNRPLRDDEIFEVVVEKTVDYWLGSIEAGVTSVRPDELELPCTMTDLEYGTWMLSGSNVMVDGVVLRKDYPCDLDEVHVGNRVGMARHSDGTLHFYLDGEDRGAACSGVPPGVYAVIDLFGQCAQVSIVPPERPAVAPGRLALPDRPHQVVASRSSASKNRRLLRSSGNCDFLFEETARQEMSHSELEIGSEESAHTAMFHEGEQQGKEEDESLLALTLKCSLRENKSQLLNCSFCLQSFSSKYRLIIHVFEHIDGVQPPKFVCKLCGEVFPSYVSLKKHFKISQADQDSSADKEGTFDCSAEHGSIFLQDDQDATSDKTGNVDVHTVSHLRKRSHKCDICGKYFTKLHRLKTHTLIHTGSKPHKCDTCGKTFTLLGNLKRHSLIHSGTPPHKCNTCGKSFTQSSCLKTHALIHMGRKPHKCHICDKSFTRRGDLKTHTLIHTGMRPHKCDNCGKSFTLFKNLKSHALIHTEQRPHKCDLCHKSFKWLGSLKSHALFHTGTKPHICDKCGKAFTLNSGLKRHSLIHSGTPPHRCDVCGKYFNQSTALKTHTLKHTGQKPHKCDICGKYFTLSHTLKIHTLLHTGSRPYKCDICAKSFILLSRLKCHALIHTGRKPHKCDVCEKSFTLKGTLKTHALIHTALKPYKCDTCGKSFRRYGDIKGHVLLHIGTNRGLHHGMN